MSTRPFTQHYDPFDTGVRTVVGQITTLGVMVLVVLDRLFPGKVARGRLEFMFDVDPKTLAKSLNNLETFGFASRSGGSKAELWIATDLGRGALRQSGLAASTAASTALLPPSAQPAQPALPFLSARPEIDGEILSAPVSSSDLIDQINPELIDQINPEEEEEPLEKFSETAAGRVAAVTAWLDQHAVTGDKRRDVLADAWCTAGRLEAWWLEMKRRETIGAIKFRTRFGPLNYAITCCLHHDEPPAPAFAPPVVTENFSAGDQRDPLADAQRQYPPVESQVWRYIRDELASDCRSIAVRRICEALYPAVFDEARLCLVVVEPTGLTIARQFQTSIQRMLLRDTQRAYTVEFVTP